MVSIASPKPREQETKTFVLRTILTMAILDSNRIIIFIARSRQKDETEIRPFQQEHRSQARGKRGSNQYSKAKGREGPSLTTYAGSLPFLSYRKCPVPDIESELNRPATRVMTRWAIAKPHL